MALKIAAWNQKMVFALILSSLSATSCAPSAVNQIRPGDAMMPQSDGGKESSVVDQLNQAIAAAALQTTVSSDDYRIGPEDLLEITLFNIPPSEATVTPRSVILRVSQQGRLALPLLGEMEVKGLTVASFEEVLRQKYEKYILNPQVGVQVKEYRQRVSVIGGVHKPGVFELSGPKTVIDMLALAGGVTESAGSQVHIYRQGANGRESHVLDLAVLTGSTGLINASSAPMVNMPVEAGDMINVPQAGRYFVDGAVGRPGSYSLGRQFTLTQALATAGGVDIELNSSNIQIHRRKGIGKVDIIDIDLNDLMVATIPDPQIQPEDVIFVPTSTGKYIVKRFIGTLVGGMSIGQAVSIAR
jgi:polysaccharide biosynthesis/export protein